MKIANRTFIISGGASGLGRATAEDLHRAGGYVSILDLNETNANAIINQLGSDRVKFFETDITDTDAIQAAVDGTVKWTKETGAVLGGVVCAAGVGNPALVIDRKGNPLPLDGFKFVIDINVIGTIDLARLVVPHLSTVPGVGPDSERGIIIMVASAAAYDGQSGQTAYSASKGAVVSMTLPMARDLSKYGIRVMTLAPAMFESAMTAQMPEKVKQSLLKTMEFPKRAGKPEEFAEVVRMCVESSMLNGEVIRLDGAARMPARL